MNNIYSIPCVFNLITGYYCPGCGITRMFISIFKLDFYQAFRYNPIVFILLIYAILFHVYKYINKSIFKKEIFINKIALYVIVIFLMLFGVLRNIDVFSFLSPTTI